MSHFDYLQLHPDGSFHLLSVATPPAQVEELLSRLSPTGYYKLQGDTAWLEMRSSRNKPKFVYGRVVAHADSIQVSWPQADQTSILFPRTFR